MGTHGDGVSGSFLNQGDGVCGSFFTKRQNELITPSPRVIISNEEVKNV